MKSVGVGSRCSGCSRHVMQYRGRAEYMGCSIQILRHSAGYSIIFQSGSRLSSMLGVYCWYLPGKVMSRNASRLIKCLINGTQTQK
jgi:hypothetical protein